MTHAMRIFSVFFWAAFCLAPLVLRGAVEEVGGVAYTYDVVDGRAVIGQGVAAVPADTAGDLALPQTLGGYPVAAIGGYAFYQHANITSITLPEGIESIGEYAFNQCAALTNATLCASLKTIGREAFRGCRNLGAIEIPDRVEQVGVAAFDSCDALARATIGNGLATVPEMMFSNCTNLTEVLFGSGVEAIGTEAFYRCLRLQSAVLPAGVTAIKRSAFRDCAALSGLSLGANLGFIGDFAFNACTNLTTMTLPESLESIGENAFSDCKQLQSITIPDTVTNLSYRAFYACYQLNTAIIGNGVREIGTAAFESCIALSNLQIGSSVTHIGSTAFARCEALFSAAIPPGVTHIGSGAFIETGKHRALTDAVFYWGNWCLGYKGSIPWRLTLKPGTIGIGGHAFFSSHLESIVLPEEVLYICDNAFSSCSLLESITLGSQVKVIGEHAFAGTKWYNAHPDNVPLYLGNWCVGAKGFDIAWPITLRAGTVGVADRAFANQDFPAVTLPPSIAYIGREAFLSCWAMRKAHFQGNAPKVDGDLIYDYTQQMETLVTEGATGWNGDPQSAALPEAWPLTGGARRSIALYEPIQVRVTFNPNGGAVETTGMTLESESTYGELPIPAWGVHIFDGWFTARTGGERVEAGGPVPLADITLYARWLKRFVLTVNRGTADGSILFPGDAVTIEADPAPAGWVFDRWRLETGSGFPQDFNPIVSPLAVFMPAQDVILTAIYAKTYAGGTIILRFPTSSVTVEANLSDAFFQDATQLIADAVMRLLTDYKGMQTSEPAAPFLESADLLGFKLIDLYAVNAVRNFSPRLTITRFDATGDPLREAALTLAVENGVDLTPAAAWQRLLAGGRAAVRISGGAAPGDTTTLATTPATEIGIDPRMTIRFETWPPAHFFRATLEAVE